MDGATFRPELVSQNFVTLDGRKAVRDRGGIKTEDFLIFYGKVAAQRRDDL
jgi:hypothetical protein